MFGPELPPGGVRQNEPFSEPSNSADIRNILEGCNLERELERSIDAYMTVDLVPATGGDLDMARQRASLCAEGNRLLSDAIVSNRTLQASEQRVAEMQTAYERESTSGNRETGNAGSQLRAAERTIRQLNAQLVANQEAQSAAGNARAIAQATLRRDLSQECETQFAMRCNQILHHNRAAVQKLQDDLAIQYSRIEQSRDAAMAQASALEIALRDQAQQFEATQRQQAQSVVTLRQRDRSSLESEMHAAMESLHAANESQAAGVVHSLRETERQAEAYRIAYEA